MHEDSNFSNLNLRGFSYRLSDFKVYTCIVKADQNPGQKFIA